LEPKSDKQINAYTVELKNGLTDLEMGIKKKVKSCSYFSLPSKLANPAKLSSEFDKNK